MITKMQSQSKSVGSNLFLRKSENMSCPCWEQPRAPSRHAKRRSMNTRHFESFMHLQVVLARLYAIHVTACALAMGMMTSQVMYHTFVESTYLIVFRFFLILSSYNLIE